MAWTKEDEEIYEFSKAAYLAAISIACDEQGYFAAYKASSAAQQAGEWLRTMMDMKARIEANHGEG